MPRVSINVVTFNSADRIDGCLRSVAAQTLSDYEITVIDNASTDATLDRLATWERRGVRVIANTTNAYYARGHNQALRETAGEIVLTLNPDVVIRSDYLASVVAIFDRFPGVGSVNGKLLLVPPGGLGPALTRQPVDPDALVDGTGLVISRGRRPALRGNRQLAATHCLDPAEIFGVDGACAAYRRAMLDKIAIDGEVFDEDFAIYREDVDLAWRAQLLGWESRYEPSAVGYHVRRFHVGQRRREIPPDLKRHSVKNGWLLLLKNDDPGSLLRDLPHILPYQLKILTGLVTIEPTSLGAIADTVRLLPRMRRKRAWIHERRRRSPTEMRRWFA